MLCPSVGFSTRNSYRPRNSPLRRACGSHCWGRRFTLAGLFISLACRHLNEKRPQLTHTLGPPTYGEGLGGCISPKAFSRLFPKATVPSVVELEQRCSAGVELKLPVCASQKSRTGRKPRRLAARAPKRQGRFVGAAYVVRKPRTSKLPHPGTASCLMMRMRSDMH